MRLCDSNERRPRFRAVRTRRDAAYAGTRGAATVSVNFRPRDIFLEVCGTCFYPECEERVCFPNGNGLRPRRGIRAEGTAPLPSLTAHTEAGPCYDAAPPRCARGMTPPEFTTPRIGGPNHDRDGRRQGHASRCPWHGITSY